MEIRALIVVYSQQSCHCDLETDVFHMTIPEKTIQSLLDMGISREVAIEALSRTNGDVEASVNYIFSGELPERKHGPEQSEAACLKDDDHMGTVETFENAPGSPEARSEHAASSDEDEAPARSSFDSSTSADTSVDLVKADSDDPVAILPAPRNAVIENYFALFCMAVGISFPHYFLLPDFKDLSYNKDWFRGLYLEPKYRIKFDSNDTVVIVPKEELSSKDSVILQPELLWQFQKFLAVQNTPDCMRRFVSATYLSKVLEPIVVEKLNNCEHLYDVLPTFIKSLTNDVEMCPNSPSIKELFISTAYYKPASDAEPMETLVSLLHFLPEEYDTNLYKMFNVLLYPEDDVDSDVDETYNSLGNLAPMLTVVFDEMDESTEEVHATQGVEVPLEFYPQLYTREAKESLIRDIIVRRRETQLESRKILRTLNDLKSFQGKDVTSFLSNSIDFLSRDTLVDSSTPEMSELVESLESVKDQITARKAKSMSDYKLLSQKLNSDWNISHPEISVIDHAKELGIIDEPYILTTAILSPYHYYIRQRNGQWYRTVCDEHEITRITVTRVEPKEVVNTIKAGTRFASLTPLMFTYFKKSHIDTDDTVRKILAENVGAANFSLKEEEQLKSLPSKHKEKLIDF